MNTNSLSSNNPQRRRHSALRGFAMAAVIAVGCAAGSATVYAQSTVGNIFGKAPAGNSVQAQSVTGGTQRAVEVDSKGRYNISQLPTGTYTVTLKAGDRALVRHINVPVVVGRGIQVNFDCAKGECGQAPSAP